MKNVFFLFVAAFFFIASVNAQSTVDSIQSKYKMQPMPDALTVEKTFPVIGTYQLNSTNGSSQTVTITLDTTNKGIIWISGLPEGTMKAYLKKSPGTYRIISQKAEGGAQIPEGTLFFDPTTNTLNIALGKAYDDADPTGIFNLNTATTDNSTNTDVANNTNMSSTTNGNVVKTKTKDANTKSKAKSKLVFYTATKNQMTSTDTNAAKQ